MAVKEIVRSSLKLKVLNKFVGADALSEFVDGLPMNGRTSLLYLLKASGCPDEEASFVESVRRVRNAYAHQIKLADTTLIELIKSRKDKSAIIKNICNIKDYDETDLISSYEKDGFFLRFGMIDFTMRVLFFAYHIAHKDQRAKEKR